MKHVLNDWATALFVPIYKKGSRERPESYRLIALLSHVRKVVEAAIAAHIRKKYSFSEWQLGFRTGTGAETAIVRHIDNAIHMGLTAVPDLNAACNTVPRKGLYEVAGWTQSEDTMKMIRFALQPITSTTQGDPAREMGIVAKGVAQGSPLSPMLFNLCMENLAKQMIDSVPRGGRARGHQGGSGRRRFSQMTSSCKPKMKPCYRRRRQWPRLGQRAMV